MTPASFINWLSDMKSAGLARSDAGCAKLLGITPNGLLKMKQRGASRAVALACRALLHRMDPYE